MRKRSNFDEIAFKKKKKKKDKKKEEEKADRSTGASIFSFLAHAIYFTEVWHDHTFHMTVPGSQAHAHVSGLRPAVSYQFRIYAENELGRSQASDVSISKLNMQHRSRLTRPAFRTIPLRILPLLQHFRHPNVDSHSQDRSSAF